MATEDIEPNENEIETEPIEPNEDEIENTNVEHENSENKNVSGTVVIVEMKLVKMKAQMADIIVVNMRIMKTKTMENRKANLMWKVVNWIC